MLYYVYPSNRSALVRIRSVMDSGKFWKVFKIMWNKEEQHAFDCGYSEGLAIAYMNIELNRPYCNEKLCVNSLLGERCKRCIRNELMHDYFEKKK